MIATDQSTIRDAIRHFVQSATRTPLLDDDANLFESGIVNSLFAIQLMTFLEREFDIEVTPDDLDIEHFKSLNATAAFVAGKLEPHHG
jgi:acyl carrier protein